MNRTHAGWIGFLGCLGMMATLTYNDVAQLHNWGQIVSPAFVAIIMAHFGVVTGSFLAGKTIPENRNGRRTRSSD